MVIYYYILFISLLKYFTHCYPAIPVAFKQSWFPADPAAAWFSLIETDLFNTIRTFRHYDQLQEWHKVFMNTEKDRYEMRMNQKSKFITSECNKLCNYHKIPPKGQIKRSSIGMFHYPRGVLPESFVTVGLLQSTNIFIRVPKRFHINITLIYFKTI